MASGVEFDEDKFSYSPVRQQGAQGMPAAPDAYGRPHYASRSSGMSGWLISHGWAKSEKSAQGILMVLVVVNLVITYIVVRYFL